MVGCDHRGFRDAALPALDAMVEISKTSRMKNFSLPSSILIGIAMVFFTILSGAQLPASTAISSKAGAALQSCPVVEEEIVDLELLALGLKKSKAVGLIEKLRLKSAIDDMLDRFVAYHAGDNRYALTELQEQYDVLLMRIASNLQHKDTNLHGQLCNAWKLIWLDLEDPVRFEEKFS